MYSVYILEDASVNNYKKLDCDGVDFTTIFSVADIADIANRKDNITKQISFKGTKNNNEAFGSLFHLNRSTDFTLTNRLLFNYNPLRTVDCLIYEDSMLVFRGSLRVLQMPINNGNVTYDTVVTGAFIDFKTALSEKQLTDLDFSDLSHRYKVDNISNTWSTGYETTTTTIVGGVPVLTHTLKPYSKGSGYVYPFIDYAYTLNNSAYQDMNYLNEKNMRPAIFVKEYVDRIVESVPGYTYEIKGSSTLIEKFNSLIVPDNTEKPQFSITGKYLQLSNTTPRTYTTQGMPTQKVNGVMYSEFTAEFAIPLPIETVVTVNNLSSVSFPDLFDYEGTNYSGLGNVVFRLNRSLRSTSRVNVELANITNHNPTLTMRYSVELWARTYISTGSGDYNDVLYNFFNHSTANEFIKPGVNSFLIAPSTTLASRTVTFDIGENEYEPNTQFFLMVYTQYNGGDSSAYDHPEITMTVNSAYVNFAKDGFTTFNADYNLQAVGVTPYDIRKPEVPQGIKQMDFLKSIISLFNFYVYTEKNKPKHLIFQCYDDYYANASVVNMQSTALNWTKKIDHNGFVQKSNVQIPKNYLFTYKDDTDYLNDDYKKLFNEAYGSKKFSDDYGVTENKKVEVIFSPTLLVQPAGISKVFPMISKDGVQYGEKQPTKSNIRILFYNGLKWCDENWNIVKETKDTAGAFVDTIMYSTTVMLYPNTSHYFSTSSTNYMVPTDNLLFDTPKKFWFNATADYTSSVPVYESYYIGQTTDLTNPDVVFVECDAYLTPVDMANLDLQIPVFVDFGSTGHAYFKVLKVEYTNSDSTSKVLLQKIAV